MNVDWSRQLEAVHVDGRVLAVDHRDTTKRNSGGWFVTLVGANWIVDDEGQVLRSGWRIRNVAQAPQPPHPASSPSEVGPEVVERMIALVRRVSDSRYGADMHVNDFAEARAIVALLPEPVDADLVEARRIVCDSVPSWNDDHRRACMRGDYDSNLFVVIARRALEKEAGR